MDPIPLSAAIAEIRRELKTALLTKDDQIDLEVDDIELEMTLEVARTRTGGLGVSVLGVVDGKGDRSRTEGSLHRIKLSLHPAVKGANGEPETLRLSDTEDP